MARMGSFLSLLDWERGMAFVMFSVAALFLLPVTAYAGAQQLGYGVFVSAVIAGVGVAVGVQLVRWRQANLKRSNA
jgi:NADH:ubiquinone oxidoreductase subunit 3 (subunit A)